jgi:hypothetical protein
MKTKVAALLAALVVAPSAFGSAQLIAVQERSKGGNVAVTLDVAVTGRESGFDIKIETDASSIKEVDLSQCVASLPKDRTGGCGFKDGVVIIGVYSPNGDTIPAGIISVGRIVVKTAEGSARVSHFGAFDQAGADVSSTVANAR